MCATQKWVFAKISWREIQVTQLTRHNKQDASSDIIRITSARTNWGNLVEASSYVTPRNILTPNKDIGKIWTQRQHSSTWSGEDPDVISHHPPSTQGRARHWTILRVSCWLPSKCNTTRPEMDSTQRIQLTRKRAVAKASLTRMQNFLESGDLKVNEIKVRLDKLPSILNKF